MMLTIMRRFCQSLVKKQVKSDNSEIIATNSFIIQLGMSYSPRNDLPAPYIKRTTDPHEMMCIEFTYNLSEALSFDTAQDAAVWLLTNYDEELNAKSLPRVLEVKSVHVVEKALAI